MRFLSPVCQRAASYAIATAEANAKMYRIVACPTAGSCGILPAVLSAVAEETNASMYDITCALFTAGAIGRVIAEKRPLPAPWEAARRNVEQPAAWRQRRL